MIQDWTLKIRYKMNTLLLNEEIERFKLLSAYSTDKTLSENFILLEDGLFGRVLQNLTRNKVFDDAAIALKELPMFKGAGDDAAKTFLADLRAGGKSLSKEQLKSFQTQLLKDKSLANTAAKDLVDAAADGYARQLLNSKGQKAVIFQNAQMRDRPRLLKDAGYSGNASQRIIDKYVQAEKELLKQGGKPGGQQVAKQGVNAATDASTQVAKQGAETAKKGIIAKSKEAMVKYKDRLINSLKTQGWKKTLAVATGLGVTGAVLWQLAKDNNIKDADTPPTPPSNEVISASGVVGGTSVPAELGGVEGVKKFQTWLDQNYPKWHSKYGVLGNNVNRGWGKFGPNTTKAWNNPEIRAAWNSATSSGESEETQVGSTAPVQAVPIARRAGNTEIPTTKISPKVPTLNAPTTELSLDQQFQMAKMNLDNAKAELDAAQASNDRTQISAARGKQQAARAEVRRLRNELANLAAQQ